MAITLIIGGNRGIGLEFCRQLAARGEDIIATCRNNSPKLAALNIPVIDAIDVSIYADIEKLRQALKGKDIQTLIHNAGILFNESWDDLDITRIEKQFQTNTLGPLRVIHALRQQILEGGKIGIMSSRMGSITDNTSGGMYGYRISKSAVNMVGMCLSRDLAERNICVALLHPGLVATDMTHGNGIPASESAAGLIQIMDKLKKDNTGQFWHSDGSTLPW